MTLVNLNHLMKSHFPFDILICCRLLVKTGDKLNAGTDANVFVQLFGTLGDSVCIVFIYTCGRLRSDNQFTEY